MQEDPTLANSLAPSRREMLALAAGGLLSPAVGSMQAFARTPAFELPNATDGLEPFKVSVPQSAIDDLKRRLASTRWPERETVGDWSEGVPLQKAQALIAYWRDKYDWRRFEARTNRLMAPNPSEMGDVRNAVCVSGDKPATPELIIK